MADQANIIDEDGMEMMEKDREQLNEENVALKNQRQQLMREKDRLEKGYEVLLKENQRLKYAQERQSREHEREVQELRKEITELRRRPDYVRAERAERTQNEDVNEISRLNKLLSDMQKDRDSKAFEWNREKNKNEELEKMMDYCILPTRHDMVPLSMSSINNRARRLRNIRALLRPIETYFDDMECKLMQMIIKCKNSKHYYLLDFEADSHRSNIPPTNIAKYKTFHRMTDENKRKTMTLYHSFNQQMMNERLYSEMSVRNIFMPSLKNMRYIQNVLNTDIKINTVWESDEVLVNQSPEKRDSHQVEEDAEEGGGEATRMIEVSKQVGAFLQPGYAIAKLIEKLANVRDKSLEELSESEICICISTDGTIKKSLNIIVYVLNAFESQTNEMSGCVTFAALLKEEKYEEIDYFFHECHQQLQQYIDHRKIVVESNEFKLKFIMCCDYKSLLMTIGMKSVMSANNCIYCLAKKDDYSNYNKYLDVNIEENSKLIRDIDTLAHTDNPPLIYLENMDNYVIDTLHLVIRVSEKFLNSCFRAAINALDLNTNQEIEKWVDEINTHLRTHGYNSQLNFEANPQKSSPNKVSIANNDKDKEDKSQLVTRVLDYMSENNGKDWEKFAEFVMIWGLWRQFFSDIKSFDNSKDPNLFNTQLAEIFNKYIELNLREFLDFTPYMHLCGHIPRLLRRHGNIHHFNCEHIEAQNKSVKYFISRKSNYRNLPEAIIRHFIRNELTDKFKRQPKTRESWSQEQIDNLSKSTKDSVKRKEDDDQSLVKQHFRPSKKKKLTGSAQPSTSKSKR